MQFDSLLIHDDSSTVFDNEEIKRKTNLFMKKVDVKGIRQITKGMHKQLETYVSGFD